MQDEAVIFHAEDDDGHARLVRKSMERCGITNRMIRFHDGKDLMDFFRSSINGNVMEEDVMVKEMIEEAGGEKERARRRSKEGKR